MDKAEAEINWPNRLLQCVSHLNNGWACPKKRPLADLRELADNDTIYQDPAAIELLPVTEHPLDASWVIGPSDILRQRTVRNAKGFHVFH